MLIFLLGILMIHSVYADFKSQTVPQSPLGIRYSAATDVSRIAFNSPLVTYGSALNEIQLPAAPIQPANLKEINQNTKQSDNEIPIQSQVAVVDKIQATNTAKLIESENSQLLQAFPSTRVSSPTTAQFLSIQQFPANPQYQTNDLESTATSNRQQQTNQNLPLIMQQPQVFSTHQQQYLEPPKLLNNAQFISPARSQTFYQSATNRPIANTFFATGPFAAPAAAQQQSRTQFIGNNLATIQTSPVQYSQSLLQYPRVVVPQYNLQSSFPNSPTTNFMSQMRFNGVTGGFAYSF